MLITSCAAEVAVRHHGRIIITRPLQGTKRRATASLTGGALVISQVAHGGETDRTIQAIRFSPLYYIFGQLPVTNAGVSGAAHARERPGIMKKKILRDPLKFFEICAH